MLLLPWHRRSSYEPDAPARGVPQSPRWRVGLVCAKDAKLSCRANIYLTRPLVKRIFELLKVERHQRLQLLGVRGRNAVEDFLDGGLKVGELRMVAAVEGTTFGELPQAFDQVQVGRVRGEEQQRDTQLTGQCLDCGVVLMSRALSNTSVIAPVRPNAAIFRNSSLIVSVLTTVVLVTAIRWHVTAFPPQDIEPLTSRSRTHEDPRERPQVTQEGSRTRNGPRRRRTRDLHRLGRQPGPASVQAGLKREKSGLVSGEEDVLGFWEVMLAQTIKISKDPSREATAQPGGAGPAAAAR